MHSRWLRAAGALALVTAPPLLVHRCVEGEARAEQAVWALLASGETVSADTWAWPTPELDALHVSAELPGLQPSTWAAFREVAAESVPFPADLHTERPYTLLDREDEAACFAAAAETTLPCAFVDLTRVGLSRDLSQALVLRGRFAGHGVSSRLLLLEHRDGAWVLASELELPEG